MSKRQESCKNNGQKGGRPKQDSKINIKLPESDVVILTPAQYGRLKNKYGDDLLHNAIKILGDWLKTGGKKYVGKNHYAHFRRDGWLINEAARCLGKIISQS